MSYLRPSVNVETSAAPPSAGLGDLATRTFILGTVDRAPSELVSVRNLRDADSKLGGRQSYSPVYESLAAFFAEGGSEAIVAPVYGPAAVKGTVALNDRQVTPEVILTATATTPGAWSNGLVITVADGDGDTVNVTVALDGTQVAVIFNATAQELADWEPGWVDFTLGASTATGSEALPAVGDSTLAGGDADHANITITEKEATLALITVDQAPGLLTYPGASGATLTALADHAESTPGIMALVSVSLDKATAISEVQALRSASVDPSYVAVFHGTVKRVGSDGVLRTVDPEVVAAGLIARASRTATPNTAVAGDRHGQLRAARVTSTVSPADRDELTREGVNTYKGSALYGSRTVDITTAWQSLGAARLRQVIETEALAIGQAFHFATIDGRGRTVAAFAGQLTAALDVHYEAGDLYGATPADARLVDTSGNTPQTAAANELHADIAVRPSPFAEVVAIRVVAYAADQALPA